jgi:hypothetical protein
VETRTISSGVQGINPASYVMVSPEKVASAELTSAQSQVQKRLAEKGYRPANDATLNVQVGVAARPASLSLTQPSGILGEARKKSAPSKCSWNEYRVTVVITQISNGGEVYRSSAGEYHCKESLDQTIPALVDAALADLGAPRGLAKTKRKL